MSAAKKVSPQAAAVAEQGYTTTPPTCAKCAHLKSELRLPAWMIVENAEARSHKLTNYWTIEKHGIENNPRCGIGGFAVKKMATCSKFERKDLE